MKRAKIVVACLSLSVLGAGFACDSGAPYPSADKFAAPRDPLAPPNMLLYIVDTLRADALGPYAGDESLTPALSDFARNSVVFENAYAQSSWTRASVASILTAQYPKTHAAEDRGDRLGDAATLLSETVGNYGYHTGLITTNPNVGTFFGFDQGFDDVIELFEQSESLEINPAKQTATAEDVARSVRAWLETAREPFLLVVLSLDPHSPYTPPAKFDTAAATYRGRVDGTSAWINRKDLTAGDKARIRSLYAAEVAYADHGFGQVLHHLRDLQLGPRTITLFTSDHGEEFWEHGRRGHGKTLYDEALHVPLIVHYPSALGPGKREARRIETLDIFPSLLDLASLPELAATSRRSLFARELGAESPLFASLQLGEHHLASVRDGNWKLIWDLNSNQRQLFDIRTPGEAHDVQTTSSARTSAMVKLLSRHLLDTEQRRRDLHIGGTPHPVDNKDLPETERELLIRLGYIDASQDDAEHPEPEEAH